MKNILYINPLGEKIFFATFIDNLRQGNFVDIPFFHFAENFPTILNEYIKKYNIQEIWIISGPGTFTKTRIITLTVNAIKFSYPQTIIKSAHFFDIIDTKKNIPIIQANKTEFLIRKNNKDILVTKEELEDNIYTGYISDNDFGFLFTPYNNIDNFDIIFEKFSKIDEVNFITPIYLKGPHITLTNKK